VTGPERLAVLSAHLRELAANPNHPALREREFDLAEYELHDHNNGCRTTACAVGHAWSIPELAAEGLGHEQFRRAYGYVAVPTYHGYAHGAQALEAFFGVKEEDAERLFMPWTYEHRDRRNPAAVADRIDAYLAGLAG
jgi:hypothetical protein